MLKVRWVRYVRDKRWPGRWRRAAAAAGDGGGRVAAFCSLVQLLDTLLLSTLQDARLGGE